MLTFLMAHWALFSSVGGALVFGLIAALLRVVAPSALATHWRALVAGVLGLAAVLALLFLYESWQVAVARLATAEANYQTVLGQNRTLNADNANLTQQVGLQNKTIDFYATAAKQAEAEASAALAAAQAKQAGDRATIATLQARAASNTTGSCEDEIAFIRGRL